MSLFVLTPLSGQGGCDVKKKKRTFHGLQIPMLGKWSNGKLRTLCANITAFGGSLEGEPHLIVVQYGHVLTDELTSRTSEKARVPLVKEAWLSDCFQDIHLHNPLRYLIPTQQRELFADKLRRQFCRRD